MNRPEVRRNAPLNVSTVHVRSGNHCLRLQLRERVLRRTPVHLIELERFKMFFFTILAVKFDKERYSASLGVVLVVRHNTGN